MQIISNGDNLHEMPKPFSEKKKKISITKTRLFKYIENLTTKKRKHRMKNSGSFHISAQNIDRGYLLEPPRRGGSIEFYNIYFEQK